MAARAFPPARQPARVSFDVLGAMAAEGKRTHASGERYGECRGLRLMAEAAGVREQSLNIEPHDASHQTSKPRGATKTASMTASQQRVASVTT